MPHRIYLTKKTSKLQVGPINMLRDCFSPSSIYFAVYHGRKRSKKYSSSSPTIDMISKVSYQSLHNAINGFSIYNLIGSGSCSSIYKGSFECQEVFVIKVIKHQMRGAHKSFIAECNALRHVRHRNWFKIISCYYSIYYKDQEFKALVYEYMANASFGILAAPKNRKSRLSNNFA